ncbi:hypothetical protein [Rhodoflexus caldus]|uniref:hypothetical protein n=1 Tax=Rhodoflexus caldus TaxID=2891236 RepID=UPI00202A20E0|nr:hypothetical protein [Rhodoflexus caldus]
MSEITDIKATLHKFDAIQAPFAGISFYFGDGLDKEFIFPPGGLGRHFIPEVRAMLSERLAALEAEFAALQDEDEPEPYHTLLPPSSMEIAASAEEGAQQ